MRRTNPMPRVNSLRRTNPIPRPSDAPSKANVRLMCVMEWLRYASMDSLGGLAWVGRRAAGRHPAPSEPNPPRIGMDVRAEQTQSAGGHCAERTQFGGRARESVAWRSPPSPGDGARGGRGSPVGPGGDRHALRAHGASSWARGPGRCGAWAGVRACGPAPGWAVRSHRGMGSTQAAAGTLAGAANRLSARTGGGGLGTGDGSVGRAG
jgi:hypothetical protein